ncbi:MAG: DoxX family protein [Candidatus Paceibacterota bacterium]|jgi:putative oxidoreductase
MRKLNQYKNQDLGLFLVRLALAVVFIIHGWLKLTDMSGTVSFFESMVGVAGFWAYVVALVEFVGGITMLLGVWTYWTGVLLAINMLFAIILFKLGKGFVGGWEYDFVLLLCALSIATVGPGIYTVKKIIGR